MMAFILFFLATFYLPYTFQGIEIYDNSQALIQLSFDRSLKLRKDEVMLDTMSFIRMIEKYKTTYFKAPLYLHSSEFVFEPQTELSKKVTATLVIGGFKEEIKVKYYLEVRGQ